MTINVLVLAHAFVHDPKYLSPSSVVVSSVALRAHRNAVVPLFVNQQKDLNEFFLRELWLRRSTASPSSGDNDDDAATRVVRTMMAPTPPIIVPTLKFVHRMSIRLSTGYDFSILQSLFPFMETKNNLRHVSFTGPMYRRLTQRRHVEDGTYEFLRILRTLPGPLFSFSTSGVEFARPGNDDVGDGSSTILNLVIRALEVTSKCSLQLLRLSASLIPEHDRTAIFLAGPPPLPHSLPCFPLDRNTFINLRELDLSNTKLTCGIEFEMLPRKLQKVNLVGCGLWFLPTTKNPTYEEDGPYVRITMGDWNMLPQNLTELRISQNHLDGYVPFDMLPMMSLEVFDIASNRFEQKIDSEMVLNFAHSCTRLRVLCLHSNNFDLSAFDDGYVRSRLPPWFETLRVSE